MWKKFSRLLNSEILGIVSLIICLLVLMKFIACQSDVVL